MSKVATNSEIRAGPDQDPTGPDAAAVASRRLR